MYQHTSLVIRATLFIGLSLLTSWVFSDKSPSTATLLFDCKIEQPPYKASWNPLTPVKVYFDVGTGYSEERSYSVILPRHIGWIPAHLKLPNARIQGLRLDPATESVLFSIRNVRVINASRDSTYPIDNSQIIAQNEILERFDFSDHVAFQTALKTAPDARNSSDPQLNIVLTRPIDLELNNSQQFRAILVRYKDALLSPWPFIFWSLVFFDFSRPLRWSQKNLRRLSFKGTMKKTRA